MKAKESNLTADENLAAWEVLGGLLGLLIGAAIVAFILWLVVYFDGPTPRCSLPWAP